MPKLQSRATLAGTPANVSVAPAVAANIPTTLHALQRVELAPNSLMQVKQAIAPMLQQIVQAAGFQLSAADLQELNQAFLDRGTISIAAAADSGNSLNVEATSLTWSSAISSPVTTEGLAALGR